jgi:hypothetical protein
VSAVRVHTSDRSKKAFLSVEMSSAFIRSATLSKDLLSTHLSDRTSTLDRHNPLRALSLADVTVSAGDTIELQVRIRGRNIGAFGFDKQPPNCASGIADEDGKAIAIVIASTSSVEKPGSFSESFSSERTIRLAVTAQSEKANISTILPGLNLGDSCKLDLVYVIGGAKKASRWDNSRMKLPERLIRAEHAGPGESDLVTNVPNPFNPETIIGYRLKEPAQVTLAVHDLLGREVAVLVDSFKPAGSHSVTWNPRDLPSGTYICRMTLRESSGRHIARSMKVQYLR